METDIQKVYTQITEKEMEMKESGEKVNKETGHPKQRSYDRPMQSRRP